MKVKIEDNKPKLTVVERKILNELKQYDYKISQKEIARILGISSSSVCKHEKNLEEKGYNIKEERKERKKTQLTQKQQELLDLLESRNYTITQIEIARIMHITRQRVNNIINEMTIKGYTIELKKPIKKDEKKCMLKEKNKIELKQLSEKEKELLSIYEERDYKVTSKDFINIMKIYPSCIQRLIQKFCEFSLPQEDAKRVAKFIKYKTNLKKLPQKIENSNKINYDNIGILIDELLQDQKEDKTKAVEFVIAYEKILLKRGLERVEEPLYKLLLKHNIKLTKLQCLEIKDLINTYEQMIKEKKDLTMQKMEQPSIQQDKGIEL